MLYLVYVLTFLAGILFYALTPRDDQVNLDHYRAEGFITSFVAQHQAAKDYLSTWLGFDKQNAGNNPVNLSYKFMEYFPARVISEVCCIDSDHDGVCDSETTGNLAHSNASPADGDGDGECFVSRIFCLNSAESDLNTCDTADIKNTYLVTYGGWGPRGADGFYTRPSWWPKPTTNRQRRNESWRRAIAKRTHGSYNCGTLTKTDCGSGSSWCIDNGQTLCKGIKCAKTVPNALVENLEYAPADLEDMLICVSGIQQGPVHYMSGLTTFYDGLDNQASGAPVLLNSARNTTSVSGAAPGNWKNAMSSDRLQADFSDDTVPAAHISGVLSKTGISIAGKGPGHKLQQFSLTLLTKGSFVLQFKDTNGISNLEITSKVSDHLGDEEKLTTVITNGGTTKTCDIDFQNLLTAKQIVMWTIVSTGQEILIYQNGHLTPLMTIPTQLLDWLPSNLEIASSSGVYLYGIRYYNGQVLAPDIGIKKNFKVDSKRYGIPETQLGDYTTTTCNIAIP